MRRWFLVLATLPLLATLALATAAYAKEIEGTGTLWTKGPAWLCCGAMGDSGR